MRRSPIQGPPPLYGMQPDTRSGFSLIELLIVIAIISIMTTLGAKVLTGGSALQTSGVAMSDFALMARNEAISRNSLTALVFKNSGSQAFRSYCIMTLKRPMDGSQPASTNWVQGTSWKTLPDSVRFENSGDSNDVFTANPGIYPPLPTTSFQGETVAPSALAVVLFGPDGQVQAAGAGDSAELHMIPDLPGRTLASSSNWVRIDFNRATGNVRMTQP